MTASLIESASTSQTAPTCPVEGLLKRIDAAFGQAFAVVDTTGVVLERVTADWPRVDVFNWLPLCEQVAQRGRVEVLEDHAPLLLMAIPLPQEELGNARVAVAVLLTEANPLPEAIDSAARAFGVDATQLAAWAAGRRPWPPYAAIELAKALAESNAAMTSAVSTKAQLSDVSGQLLATFEELNLLHQLTEGLSLGRSEHDLLEQAVQWLGEIVPSDAVLASLDWGDEQSTFVAGRESPLPADELGAFFERLGPQAERRTLVLNQDRTSSPTWAYPAIREVVTAPVVSNDCVIGCLAATNYHAKRGARGNSFGSIEASLLSSVATLIGVHAGNRRLFADRAKLFESAVGALTSAIDAKDRYTCGHSDRVARMAVRLAREVGCNEEELNTIYLGGLLHDVGKIGISDSVLGKPGRLTDEEFDQIKTHPTLGEQILRGVPQLGHVLPIVLHHHESWDGSGYPGGLIGEECPKLARITAVADAIDAMGSDRPYRKGMSIERIEEILRDGAGKQWDKRVIDAYFAAREDIRSISRIEREPLGLDVGRWTEGATCPVEC
ncbi:MAG: HD domain-containing phosphohydrolase [Planctomycetota bacterium]